MKIKHPIESKIVWFNVLAFLVALGPLLLDGQIKPAIYVGFLAPLCNIMLRIFGTSQPLTTYAAGQVDEPAATMLASVAAGDITSIATGLAKLSAMTREARKQLRDLGIESFSDRELAAITTNIRANIYREAARFVEGLSSIDPAPLIYAAQEFYSRAGGKPPSDQPAIVLPLIVDEIGPWTLTKDHYICWSHLFCFPLSDDPDLGAWLLQYQPAAEAWDWIYTRDGEYTDGADIIADIRKSLHWPADQPPPAAAPDPEVAHDT
jgi:hypothetical protein